MSDNELTPAELVRTMHVELWGNNDPTAIDRYISPDARTVMTGFEGSTTDVLRDDVERYQGAFADVATEIVELIAAGDQVVLWWRTAGTHTGPYGDIAPNRPAGGSPWKASTSTASVRARSSKFVASGTPPRCTGNSIFFPKVCEIAAAEPPRQRDSAATTLNGGLLS